VWIKVLHGELIMDLYQKEENQEAVRSARPSIIIREGEYAMFNDAELGLHITRNNSEENTCISLHIYTPPYVECSFLDPTGKSKSIPVAYCDNLATDLESAAGQDESSLGLLCKFSNMVFSNFSSFSNLIGKQIDSGAELSQILRTISTVQFHPDEWQGWAPSCDHDYTRNLVAYGYNYSIYINCWKAGQANPIHDHNGSFSWIKVLQGQLDHRCYRISTEDSSLITDSSQNLAVGDTIQLGKEAIHAMENTSSEIAYSLHIYYPPVTECNTYDLSGVHSKLACAHHLKPV
jgi:predicted metal-dependent enzyme (double-stranded beta helix superfamily)